MKILKSHSVVDWQGSSRREPPSLSQENLEERRRMSKVNREKAMSGNINSQSFSYDGTSFIRYSRLENTLHSSFPAPSLSSSLR